MTEETKTALISCVVAAVVAAGASWKVAGPARAAELRAEAAETLRQERITWLLEMRGAIGDPAREAEVYERGRTLLDRVDVDELKVQLGLQARASARLQGQIQAASTAPMSASPAEAPRDAFDDARVRNDIDNLVYRLRGLNIRTTDPFAPLPS